MKKKQKKNKQFVKWADPVQKLEEKSDDAITMRDVLLHNNNVEFIKNSIMEHGAIDEEKQGQQLKNSFQEF